MITLKLLAILATGYLLSGCAQLSGAVSKDAEGAVAVAKAAGDTEAIACFTAIGNIAAAASPAASMPVEMSMGPVTMGLSGSLGFSSVGLLTKLETARAGQSLANGPCAPIVAGISLFALGLAK